jgi:hypothetical protein
MLESVIGEVRNAYIFLAGKTEEKRSLGKAKFKLEDITIMEREKREMRMWAESMGL